MTRDTIPARCNKPSAWYAQNGYRACDEHSLPGMSMAAESGPPPFGPCDYPLDGKGAARYESARKRAFSTY